MQFIWDAVTSIPNVLGELLQNILNGLSSLLDWLNPFSENFFVYKLVELLGNLLQWLFVPDDNYFNNNIDNLKANLSSKIPYNDYIEMFETIKQVESGEDISIDLKGYTVGNNTFSFNNFIDFSWITQYKETWYSWVRGIIFILLIIYNVNQIMKLFRGYNIGEGNSRDVANVYDTGSHTWVKGGDGK